MNERKYLTEENYERGKKKVMTIALVVLIIGLLIGGSLIFTGIKKQNDVNSNYSEESKTKLNEQISTEKQNLINSKTELENKIKPIQDEIKSLERAKFEGFDDAYYEREDKIEELNKSIATDKNNIEVIDGVLDESFDRCKFNEAKNNSYTSKYCSLKNQLTDKTDFNKEFDSFYSIPFYMIGGFIIVATCLISGLIFIFGKRREIMAFTTQQVMPVAKEGIDEMTPTIGNAAGSIAKGITKGIKEGLKDSEENK